MVEQVCIQIRPPSVHMRLIEEILNAKKNELFRTAQIIMRAGSHDMNSVSFRHDAGSCMNVLSPQGHNGFKEP